MRAKLFVGSTAGRVLRTTKSPVLAVPPVSRADRYPSPELAAAGRRRNRARKPRRRRCATSGRRRALVPRSRGLSPRSVPPAQTPPWLHVNSGDRDRVGLAGRRCCASRRPSAAMPSRSASCWRSRRADCRRGGGWRSGSDVLLLRPGRSTVRHAPGVRGHIACSVTRRCRSSRCRTAHGRKTGGWGLAARPGNSAKPKPPASSL
jgi:hypothetical protein